MKPVNKANRRLSINDMAERLGVDRKRIEHWAEIGVLHGVNYGNGLYFKRTADIEFFDEWEGYDLSTPESSARAVQLKKRQFKINCKSVRA